MSNEKKTSKRKSVLHWIITAACILVFAAILTVCIAAGNNWFRPSLTSGVDTNESAGKDKEEDKKPEESEKPSSGKDENKDKEEDKDGDKDKDKDKPAAVETTFVMPVSSGNVTCEYDFICNPSMCGVWYFHEAIDMAADAGSEVYACLDGTVEKISLDDQLEGNTVTVAHANGISTVYSFIDVKDGLKVGDKVARGQVIGTVAAAGGNEYLQGAHLHFAVLENGKAVDPADHLDVSIK